MRSMQPSLPTKLLSQMTVKVDSKTPCPVIGRKMNCAWNCLLYIYTSILYILLLSRLYPVPDRSSMSIDDVTCTSAPIFFFMENEAAVAVDREMDESFPKANMVFPALGFGFVERFLTEHLHIGAIVLPGLPSSIGIYCISGRSSSTNFCDYSYFALGKSFNCLSISKGFFQLLISYEHSFTYDKHRTSLGKYPQLRHITDECHQISIYFSI